MDRDRLVVKRVPWLVDFQKLGLMCVVLLICITDRERHLSLGKDSRAEIDPAGAHGESGGSATGRRAASPLQATGRLRPSPP